MLFSGAGGRDQQSPKHCTPSAEGVVLRRKVGVLTRGRERGLGYPRRKQTFTAHGAAKPALNQSPGS